MIRYVLAAMIMVLLGTALVRAESLKNTGEIRHTLDNAMMKAQSDNFSDFFQAIKPFWLISEDGFNAALAKTSAARTDVHKKLGKSLAVEQVKTEMISDTVLKIVYLEKFQKAPIVWNFYFYKPENEWFLNTFEWEDNIRILYK